MSRWVEWMCVWMAVALLVRQPLLLPPPLLLVALCGLCASRHLVQRTREDEKVVV